MAAAIASGLLLRIPRSCDLLQVGKRVVARAPCCRKSYCNLSDIHDKWGSLRRLAVPSRRVAMASTATDSVPGLVQDLDKETEQYIMQQTMYRIKDPKVSLEFYSKVLGMRLLTKLDFPEMQFTVYFMGYADPKDIPSDPAQRARWTAMQRGTVELTHNYGTENDADFKYHNGNSEPRGFGHIGITVPDVYKACERFERMGVEFAKKPDGGKMKGLAFIKDPDGYMIEIFSADTFSKLA